MQILFDKFLKIIYNNSSWRDGRAVEGARLESEYTLKRIEGSNPSLSAMVQDGGLAVPCNLQSAVAESDFFEGFLWSDAIVASWC